MTETDIVFDDDGGAPAAPAGGVQLIANPFANDTPRGALATVESDREVAAIQAQMLLARKFPRDRRQSVDRLLVECTTPVLAERATYQYPRGDEFVNGPTIRLAEAVARSWGNLRCGVKELDRTGQSSWVQAYAQDLETGFSDEKTFQVKHWRDTKKGGYYVREERDIYEVIANWAARRKRACIEAIIPREVFRIAIEQCETTLGATVGTGPEAVATMLKKFAAYGVTAEHLGAKVGRHLDDLLPSHMVLLRRIYNALHDREANPWDYFDIKRPSEPASIDARAGKSLAEVMGTASKDAPHFTFEEVRAKVEKATDKDALDAVESLLSQIEDEAQRLAAADMIALKRGAIDNQPK